MSQNILATPCSSGRHGRTANVDGLGSAMMSDFSIGLKPVSDEPSTFAVLPWRPEEQGVARMFCDILTPERTPYEGDPRHILRRALRRAAEMGFDTFNVGPELEYFLFRDSSGTEPLDSGGYFDLTTLDAGSDVRRETSI